MLFMKASAVWLTFGVIAVVLGALRTKYLTPRVGELAAHQIGTLIVCAVVGMVIYFFIRRLSPTVFQALAIGLLWLSLSVVFEFVLGHFVLGLPWGRLLADYNLFRGRLLLLLWLTILWGPYLSVKLRR